ncbi:MAG: hypothetical protein QOI07_3224 [Verrucomicrobiota bacterium]
MTPIIEFSSIGDSDACYQRLMPKFFSSINCGGLSSMMNARYRAAASILQKIMRNRVSVITAFGFWFDVNICHK